MSLHFDIIFIICIFAHYALETSMTFCLITDYFQNQLAFCFLICYIQS